MKRTAVTAPEELLDRLRQLATRLGVSLAEVIREAMEAKASELRPKPKCIGMFRSGHTDTARLSGELPIEPPPWRSS